MGKILPIKLNSISLKVLLLLYILILVFLAILQDVWIDEVYSLHTTSQGMKYAFTQAINFESQAPLYFIVLKLWRYINDSVIFARFLSVLFIVMAVLLSKELSKRYIPGLNPYFLMFLIALNPFTIWSVRVIRVYPLVILLSIIILILFHRTYLSGEKNNKGRIFYIIVAIFSVFAHYFMAFALAANGLVLLIFKKHKQFSAYMIDMIAPVLFISLFFITIIRQYFDHAEHISYLQCTLLSVLKFIVTRIEIFLTSINSLDLISIERNIIRAAIVILFILIIFLYPNREKYRDVLKNNFTLPAVIFISLIFLFFQYNSGCMLLAIRHMSILFIPLFVSFVFVINSIYKPIVAKGIFIFIMLYYIGVNAIILTSDKTKGFNRTNEYLATNEKDDQPVLLYRGELALVFKHFYTGKNAIYPLPGEVDFSRPYNDTSWVIKSTQEFADVISKVPSKSGQYWILVDDIPVLYELDYNYNKLDSLLKNDFSIKVDTTFMNLRLRLVEKEIKNE